MYLKRVLVSQVLCNNIIKTDWKKICWRVSCLIVQSQSMFCILRKVSLHTGEKLQRKGQYIYMYSVSVRDNTLQAKCSLQRIQQAANQSLQRIGHSLYLQRIQQVANIASSESPLPSKNHTTQCCYCTSVKLIVPKLSSLATNISDLNSRSVVLYQLPHLGSSN